MRPREITEMKKILLIVVCMQSLVSGAHGQDRFLNSLQDARFGRLHSGASYKEIDSGHIALFARADEFITLATEFLFREHD
jgi:hypothetical protein